MSMRPLSKAGIVCVLLALLVGGLVFNHYNGFTNPTQALAQMLNAAFWGGLVWAAIFTIIMAVLFLSA